MEEFGKEFGEEFGGAFFGDSTLCCFGAFRFDLPEI